jgi:ribonuclease P protein component
MIPKTHRFHGHRSLDYTYRHGKTAKGQGLILRYAPAKNENYRLSVVVSKKVSKSAVVRNRIRRRLYESVRIIDKEKKIPPVDLILSVHDEALATVSSTELHAAVARLLSSVLK